MCIILTICLLLVLQDLYNKQRLSYLVRHIKLSTTFNSIYTISLKRFETMHLNNVL